jgi:hypothetical protein
MHEFNGGGAGRGGQGKTGVPKIVKTQVGATYSGASALPGHLKDVWSEWNSCGSPEDEFVRPTRGKPIQVVFDSRKEKMWNRDRAATGSRLWLFPE